MTADRLAREQRLNCQRSHRDHWVVVQRRCNYSAFSGYARTPSDYSLILCTQCGRRWRTKANYVRHLPDAPDHGELTGGQRNVLRAMADGLRRYPGDGHTSAGLIEIMNELADLGLVARNGEHDDEYTITRAGAQLAGEEGP